MRLQCGQARQGVAAPQRDRLGEQAARLAEVALVPCAAGPCDEPPQHEQVVLALRHRQLVAVPDGHQHLERGGVGLAGFEPAAQPGDAGLQRLHAAVTWLATPQHLDEGVPGDRHVRRQGEQAEQELLGLRAGLDGLAVDQHPQRAEDLDPDAVAAVGLVVGLTHQVVTFGPRQLEHSCEPA
jgi:hypothetical protein